MRRTTSLVALLTLCVLAYGLPSPPRAVAATAASPITYVYDELGRLEAVIDASQTNGLARYLYDAVGNLTQITRTSITTTPRVVEFHPHQVSTGSSITIYGTGFSSTPSQNVVTFIGGATATPTAATATTLTVTVPAAAQAGAIKVKNTATNKTSALSTQTWSLPVAPPVITSVTTPLGGAHPLANHGDTVTVNGSGFASTPEGNLVRLNAAAVRVLTASPTQLTFQVPAFNISTYGAPGFIGSGPVSITTAAGSTESSQAVVLPEKGLPPTSFQQIQRFGSNEIRTVTIPAGQSNVLVLFPVTQGRFIYASTSLGAKDLLDPLGVQTTGPGNGSYSVLARYSGTYALWVQNIDTSTGPKNVTVQIEVSAPADGGTVVLNPSASVSIARTIPGQRAVFRFQGTEGRTYCIDAVYNAFYARTFVYRPSRPEGEASGSAMASSQGDVAFVAPETGTYTVFLHGDGADPPGPMTATVTDNGSSQQCPASTQIVAGDGSEGPSASASDVDDVVDNFEPVDPPDWEVDRDDPAEWITERDPSPLESLEHLVGPAGVTAVAGRVLALHGGPLEGVVVSAEGVQAVTDRAGRFVLHPLPSGRVELRVDASPASTPGATYGVFEIGADAIKGETTPLGHTIWEPALDLSTRIHIDAYPLVEDLVITSEQMPGFEVRVPAGSTITDAAGNEVHDVTLTPVPLDRQPFPGPEMNTFTMHFTLQPGDAVVEPNGFRVRYANVTDLPAGFTANVWTYEPDEGWETYGTATVSPDARYVVPERGARVEGFQGASMSAFLGWVFDTSCTEVLIEGACSADPVDLSNGLFDHRMTDLHVGGTPSISLTRIHRQDDVTTYGMGLSMATTYDMRLTSNAPLNFAELGIPGAKRVRFEPIGAPGSGVPMVAVSGPNEWLGAELVAGYSVRRRDGMRFRFGGNGVGTTMLTQITDRWLNTTIISRTYTGEIVSLLAMPSGRWITFVRASNGTITSATDSSGRTVSYTYETPPGGLERLVTVTDPTQQGLPSPARTTYAWNPSTVLCGTGAPCTNSPATQLFDVFDRRGNRELHLAYGAQGRVSAQTFANDAEQTFDYASVHPACTGGTRSVDADGRVSCALFDASGRLTSITTAQGSAQERTLGYGYTPENNAASITDTFSVGATAHTRRTDYAYGAAGAVSSITYLANSASPKTWTTTYDPGFAAPKVITDPLGHVRTFTSSYPDGCITRVADDLGRGLTLTCAAAGGPKNISDDAGGQTVLTYDSGDLIKVKDPADRFTKRFTGTDGSVRGLTDPLGYLTTLAYDLLGNVTKITPVSGSSTSFAYDTEEHLTRVTLDATGAHTDHVYDEVGLVTSRTDPLGRAESFTYEPGGALRRWTDRRGKVTRYCYDGAGGLSFIGYGYTGGGEPGCGSAFTSSTTFTLDGAGRIGTVTDPAAGTITRTYDDLDRLLSETTPQGTLTHTYDDANRRQTMTVTGQPVVSYDYFTNDQLKKITRGTNTVNLTYDLANRPDTTTLPNGVVQDWTFDAASHMTGAGYAKAGQTSLGALSYGYDATGRRTTVWGSSSRITLPAATSVASYDLANQLTTWNGAALTSDANGNLATNGAQTYTWNERNQLASTSGGSSTFRYDGLGRRYEKVVSGTTTRYLYDGPNVVQELGGTNAPTFNLITGFAPDQVFWRQGVSGANNVTNSVLTDALGSTLATTTPASTSAIRDPFTYEAYGKPSSAAFPYLFTGRDYDTATGLQFNRARYMAPGLARFTAEDPIGIAGGSANPYLYGENAPTVFADAWGLSPGGGCRFLCGSVALTPVLLWSFLVSSTGASNGGSLEVFFRSVITLLAVGSGAALFGEFALLLGASPLIVGLAMAAGAITIGYIIGSGLIDDDTVTTPDILFS